MKLEIDCNNAVHIRAWGYYWAVTLDTSEQDDLDHEDAMRRYYLSNGGNPDLIEHFEAGVMDSIQQPTYLSVTEAAERAGVGRQYVKDEVMRGNLSARKVGRQYQIEMRDFIEWANKPGRGSRT